jgi:hypothetical protein
MRLLALAALALVAVSAHAQRLTTPLASPHARVEQTVGITDLAVDYHRPAVAERPIWGALVPYGEVWRAGANENTVFETSTDLVVEGEPLPAGRYGLHVIPTEGDWTVIFSTVADAWGSYSYRPEEDALRVAVTPREAPMGERLAYRFDEPGEDAVEMVLHWEELEIPVRIAIDTPGAVLAQMERERRGVSGFYAEAWDQIAAYALDHGRRTEEALAWADRSIELGPGFSNRMTKAALLDALGRASEADALREAAYAEASEEDIRAYARSRRRAGKPDQAEAVLARLGERP